MRGLFQPIVVSMPRYQPYHLGGRRVHFHKPSLQEIFAETLFEPTQRSPVFSRDDRFSRMGKRWPLMEFQPHCAHRKADDVKKSWSQSINMSEFNPADINLKVDGNLLIVHARKDEINGENIDVKERKRVITIPDGVNKDSIKCRINRLGHFDIKGTFECDANTADKYSKSRKSTEMETEQMEQQVDCSAEHSSEHNEGNTEVNEESIQNDTHIVSSEVAHDLDAKRDMTSVMSLADCIVDTLVGDREPKAPSPRSGSPIPAEDFVILADIKDKNDGPDVDMEKDDDKQLDSIKESSEVAVSDGNKSFNVKLNLKDFQSDDISVRCRDNALIVDAKRDWNDGDILGSQSLRRMYQLPENAEKSEARACVDGEGMFSITVPITKKQPDEEIDITVEQE